MQTLTPQMGIKLEILLEAETAAHGHTSRNRDRRISEAVLC